MELLGLSLEDLREEVALVTQEHHVFVGSVRDKATLKAITVVRALVFGIIIAVAALVALVLFVILATRLLQKVLNIGGGIEHDSAVGISYLVIGALLAVAGMICMRKRHPRQAR